MTSHLRTLLVAAAIPLAGVSAAASAQPPAPPAAQQTPRDTILGFYRTWAAATAAEGAAGYARFFTPNARLAPPGAPAVVGRDSIRAWMERTQREAPTTQPESITQDEITIAGHYALVITLMRGRRVPKDGSAAVPFDARYVDVLERAPGGWLFASRTWTDSVRTATQPPPG